VKHISCYFKLIGAHSLPEVLGKQS